MTIFTVKVKPNSKQQSIAEQPDGSLTIHLKSLPVEGKANQELIMLLAKRLKAEICDRINRFPPEKRVEIPMNLQLVKNVITIFKEGSDSTLKSYIVVVELEYKIMSMK